MGIRRTELEFILECQSKGLKLGKTLTLGRQDLLTDYDNIELCLNKYEIAHDNTDIKNFYEKRQQFIEPLIEFIGAESVDSMDKSTFEGASMKHDLNEPIPDHLKNSFDTVIDSGTTEHVFNLPQAMKNIMDLLKTGGHVISILPTNNYCGHGFYQVSPELMYRVFSKNNNFKVNIMIFCVHKNNDEWYELTDPEVTGARVEPRSINPSSLLMMATKISDREVYATHPQQSDYANEWTNMGAKGDTVNRLHFWRGSKEPSSSTRVKKLSSTLKRTIKTTLDKFLNLLGLARANPALEHNPFSLYKRR